MISFIVERWFSGSGPGALSSIVLRDLLAAATALVIALLFGRWFIRFQLERRHLERADKGDSERLAEMHRSKSSTPTMGGVIFLAALLPSTLLWARLENRLVWLLLATAVALGALGLFDDWVKFSSHDRKGVSARTKLLTQILLGSVVGILLFLDPIGVDGEAGTTLVIPFLKAAVPLGVLFVPFVAVVVTGSSNAVNLTDGLDGLAIGCAILAGMPFAVVALLSGHVETAAVLDMPSIPEALEISVFASSLVGAAIGFLWFNCHPARVFMGDTGALALGGSLGLMALLTKKEFFFLVVGGVFVVETLSVILQVVSFKLRGKRIFLIAPLHHHFQFRGWDETRVTTRFWIVAALLATFSMATVSYW